LSRDPIDGLPGCSAAGTGSSDKMSEAIPGKALCLHRPDEPSMAPRISHDPPILTDD
jgi:hypothetical protein